MKIIAVSIFPNGTINKKFTFKDNRDVVVAITVNHLPTQLSWVESQTFPSVRKLYMETTTEGSAGKVFVLTIPSCYRRAEGHSRIRSRARFRRVKHVVACVDHSRFRPGAHYRRRGFSSHLAERLTPLSLSLSLSPA